MQKQILGAIVIGVVAGILTRILAPSNLPGERLGGAISVGITGAVAAISIVHRLFSTDLLCGLIAGGIGAAALCWGWATWRGK